MANNIPSLNDIRSALNKEGDPWEAGPTSMSALLPDEQHLRLGVKPPPGKPSIAEVAQLSKQTQEEMKAKARMAAAGAPAAYDLRNADGKNFVTPVRDQAACGSCVAFGAIATMEGRLRVQRNDPNLAVNLSEAHLFFCHARARGANCDTGWWPNEAYEDLQNKGVVDEACYPYNLSNRDCSGLCSNATERTVKIAGATELTNKPADIKTSISSKDGGPVSACLIVYQDFFNYKSGIYKHLTGEQAGGHCVTIVGYNDNPGYWICKNSWGSGWGEQGFFNIAYGECGIDSWSNHFVTGIANTGWQNDKRIIGLWATNQERNAWVYFAGLGWRRIASDSDAVFFEMLANLIAAKAAARPVNFYEENSVIRQAYVY